MSPTESSLMSTGDLTPLSDHVSSGPTALIKGDREEA